jgi:hypothetical protein
MRREPFDADYVEGGRDDPMIWRASDRDLLALQKSDEMARYLATNPGIGPIGATFAVPVTDPGQFQVRPPIRRLALVFFLDADFLGDACCRTAHRRVWT